MRPDPELDKVWTEHALQAQWDLDKITSDSIAREKENFIVRTLRAFPAEQRAAMRVLDVGCGVGQYTKTASLLGCIAEGIEISGQAVEIAQSHGLKVWRGDMRSLPYDAETFDLVIAGGSMEHFRDTEKALREVRRVLKPSGSLLGNVPYRYTLYVLAKFAQQAAGVWKCGYEKSFSIHRWRQLCYECGFDVTAVERSRYRAGKHRILGGMLEFADGVTNLVGLGGHHIFFTAVPR
jgi:SAM-dependent methyltransferase